MNKEKKFLSESVCPVCLRRITAEKVYEGSSVYLEKHCPEHGEFRVKIWDGSPDYTDWDKPKIPATPVNPAAPVERGCPYDCGLCSDHRQHTCCVLLEVTERCNLRCPVCFADAGKHPAPDPGIDEIARWYRMLLDKGGPFNIQLSGGEPTVRDDLPEIIRLGAGMGFTFFQLNTNGLRIAEDLSCLEELRDAGLNCVFLQFDGLNDSIHNRLRGRALHDTKLRAIENCRKAGIGVVLVPTLVPGVNTADIGDIIDFAVENIPSVRGVHFQPVSYFGRCNGLQRERITIPEIIRCIERQTGGRMKAENFSAPGGENSYCSFHGNFILMPGGKIQPWTQPNSSCCSKPAPVNDGSVKARQFVAKQWSTSSCCASVKPAEKQNRVSMPGINTDSLDVFLERINTHSICISGMAFQDAWTLEIERLKECLIHVVSRDGRLIPFCAYNLTSESGRSIYRGNDAGA